MPYNTRSRPLPSAISPSPSTPIRRPSAAQHAPVSPPVPVSPLIKDAIPREDADNDVLMAVVSLLAETKEPRSLSTGEMAKLTPHSAQVLSGVIRAHLRRDNPPPLLVRHAAFDGGKIPTYSLNLPSPSFSLSAMGKAAEQTMAEPFPSPLSSPSPLDSRDYSDDMAVDEKPVIKMEDDDMHEEYQSPPGSVSPVITPPPLLSTSIPRLRSHFAEHILLPSRGISPDATSDGSSPPSTPRSPSSPLVPAKAPISPTTGILSDGFRTLFLKEEPGLMEYSVNGTQAELFSNPNMLGTSFFAVNTDAPGTTETVSTSPKLAPSPTLDNFQDVVVDWDSDEWMLGPESMPLDELDRELTAAWRTR